MRKVIVREVSYRGESGTLSLCVIYCKVRGAYSTQWRYIGSVHMYHNVFVKQRKISHFSLCNPTNLCNPTTLVFLIVCKSVSLIQ